MQDPEIWAVPMHAHIQLAEGDGHLLNGATITFWKDGE